MRIQYDREQLRQMYHEWTKVHLRIIEALGALHSCEQKLLMTDLPDIHGLLSGTGESLSDLYRLLDRIERVLEYLRHAIELAADAERSADDLTMDRRASAADIEKQIDSPVWDDWDDSFTRFDSDIDAAPPPRTDDDDDWGDWSSHGSSFDAPPPSFNDDVPAVGQFSRIEDEAAEYSGWKLPEWEGDPWDEGVGLAVREGNLPPRLAERERSLPEEADEAFRGPEPPKKKKKIPSLFRRENDFVLASPAVNPIDLIKRHERQLEDTVCFCINCGSSVPAGTIFCPRCGTRLRDAAPKNEPKPAPRPSQVQFTAVAPRQFTRGEYALVDIFMYEEKWRHVVDQYVRSMDEPAQEKSSGYRDVAADAMVRIVLSSKDVEIDDNEESARWTGKYLQFSFAVSVPEDFDKKQIQLKATVYVNDVPLTHLIWTLKRKAWRSQIAEAMRRDINSIFMSYSSRDRSTVATIIKGIQLVRPDIDIFFDVDSLYSGDKWKKRLQQEIDNRDMLFLCWSRSACESKYVDFEWRYALERKGIDCIQPVPLEQPSLCPPPPELNELHFNDKLLYIINAN